jgi:hypothetical protein
MKKRCYLWTLRSAYNAKRQRKHFARTNFVTHLSQIFKYVVHNNVVGGSSMVGFSLVIAVSERDMPEIEPGLLGWHTSALTNELQEVRFFVLGHGNC